MFCCGRAKDVEELDPVVVVARPPSHDDVRKKPKHTNTAKKPESDQGVFAVGDHMLATNDLLRRLRDGTWQTIIPQKKLDGDSFRTQEYVFRSFKDGEQAHAFLEQNHAPECEHDLDRMISDAVHVRSKVRDILVAEQTAFLNQHEGKANFSCVFKDRIKTRESLRRKFFIRLQRAHDEEKPFTFDFEINDLYGTRFVMGGDDPRGEVMLIAQRLFPGINLENIRKSDYSKQNEHFTAVGVRITSARTRPYSKKLMKNPEHTVGCYGPVYMTGHCLDQQGKHEVLFEIQIWPALSFSMQNWQEGFIYKDELLKFDDPEYFYDQLKPYKKAIDNYMLYVESVRNGLDVLKPQPRPTIDKYPNIRSEHVFPEDLPPMPAAL